MEFQDLKSVSQVGVALFRELGVARIQMLDSLAALRIKNGETSTEKWVHLLLKRALLQTPKNSVFNNDPFFRLSPIERVVLVGLQLGHWSYRRLGEILEVPVEKVSEIAWAARLKLAKGKYPAGAPLRGRNCPEYHYQDPWMQKLLDDEISTKRDQLFLTNHLMACSSCQKAFGRVKDLYYEVDAILHSALSSNEEEFDSLAKEVEIELNGATRMNYAELSFTDSLRIFTARRESKWLLLIAAFVFGLLISKKI